MTSASPLIASVLFLPCSAARLLLVAALLAAIGPGACVHVCLSSVAATTPGHGETVQSDQKSNEAHPRAAGE